jgi:DNA-binding protein H-NS
MKVVQTTLTETEHRLLEEYARKNSKTIKEVVNEAIKKVIIEDKIDPNDPLFIEPPSSKRTGKKDDGSTKHDYYLYGIKK